MRFGRPGRASSSRLVHAFSTRADAVTWLTIYVVVLFGVPSRLVVGPLGSAGAVSMLLGLASMGIWLLLRVGAARPLSYPADPLGISLGLFLFSVGISYTLAMSRPISSDEISPADLALLSLLSWTGTLLMTRDGVRSRDRLDTLVWRIAAVGGLLAILGLAQFLTRQSLVDAISIPGLTSVRDAFAFFRDGRIRPSGTAIHPLEYGTILSLLLPLAFHVAFHHRRRPLLIRWIPAVTIGGVIAISSSRAAYLTALLALAICMIAWTPKQRGIILSLAAGGIGILALIRSRLIDSILDLFQGLTGDPSVESRTDGFSIAWHFVIQHPYFGRGLGTFLPKYRIFDNQYLLLLVSIGVIGTVLFFALLAVAAIQLTRTFRSAREQSTKDLANSLIGSVLAGALSLAFFDAFAFPMTMGTFFLMIGIGGSLVRQILYASQQNGEAAAGFEGALTERQAGTAP